MSQILKTFLGLFLILTMVATSAGILSSFLSVMTAQNMHAAMISEMEDSDFYPQVIMDCFNFLYLSINLIIVLTVQPLASTVVQSKTSKVNFQYILYK